MASISPIPFSISSINPIFENDECCCLFCSRVMNRGASFYHQNNHCPYRPKNKLDQFKKIVFLICIDSKSKAFFDGVFHLIQFCNFDIMPVVLYVYELIDNEKQIDCRVLRSLDKKLQRTFDLLSWKKIPTVLDVVLISSYQFLNDFSPLSEMMSLIIKFASQPVNYDCIRNNFYCFINDNANNATDQLFNQPLIKYASGFWKSFIVKDINNFENINQPFIHIISSETGIKIKDLETIGWKEMRYVVDYQPLKTTTKCVNRVSICSSCGKPSRPSDHGCDPKTTMLQQCQYCCAQFSITNVKKHEVICEYSSNDINDSDFIIVIGVLGDHENPHKAFSKFLQQKFSTDPKAHICHIVAKDSSDFINKLNNSSVNVIKYFNKVNKGRIFMVIFVKDVPNFKLFSPLFLQFDNLFKIYFSHHTSIDQKIDRGSIAYPLPPNTDYFINYDRMSIIGLTSLITIIDQSLSVRIPPENV